MRITVKVPDVAVDIAEGHLTFKLDLLVQENTLASPQPQTIFRNYNQIAWLHARLQDRYSHVLIPPLPEKPGATDADYVEKKRLQMERFLVKLFARSEIVEMDSDVQYFLGESMTSADVTVPKPKSQLDLSMFSKVIKSEYQHGFRVFKSSDFIETFEEQDEFRNRQAYALTLEQNFSTLLEQFTRMVKYEEAVAKATQQAGYAFKECLMDETTAHPDAERLAQILDGFYEWSGVWKSIAQKQAKDEILMFGDVFLEYKNTVDCIKRIMNNRTNLHIDYYEANKNRLKRFEKLQKAKIKVPVDQSEIDLAEAEHKKACEDCEQLKEQFAKVKQSLTKELVRFEKEKARDFHKAVQDFATIQVRAEQEQMNAAKKLLDSLDKNLSL